MSLVISSTNIIIQNSNGVEKFNATNKLVYPKSTKTGTVTVGSSLVSVPFVALGSNDFLVLTFKINSCNGNVGSSLIGIEIPANGSVITHFYPRLESRVGKSSTDYLGAMVLGDQLVFRAIKVDGMSSPYYDVCANTTITTNLTYRAVIYSYL